MSPTMNARKVLVLCRVSQDVRMMNAGRAFAEAMGQISKRAYAEDLGLQSDYERAEWIQFSRRWRVEILNWICLTQTAFATFDDLLNAKGGYRPTLRPDLNWLYLVLACEYNAEQDARGDERRAYTPDFTISQTTVVWTDRRFPTENGWRTITANGQVSANV